MHLFPFIVSLFFCHLTTWATPSETPGESQHPECMFEEHHDQYDAVARLFSEKFLKYNQNSIQAYFRSFDVTMANKRVLDLGCGEGFDMKVFSERGALVYGVDSSIEMVQLARQKNPESVVEVSSFEKVPFEDSTFDFVVSKWALQSAGTIDPIYEEIHRVLKPGGKLVCLICHPIRQYVEKKKKGKNYFEKEIIHSSLFDGQILVQEPSHTLSEYLSPVFFNHFVLEAFEEGINLGAEKIDNDVYPSYFIMKATRK